MSPNTPAVVGKEAIRSRLQPYFNQFTLRLTASPEEFEVAGDWAFERGTYASTSTPKAGGEPTEDKGKYLAIWKRQPDGSWKRHRGILNSDLPLPGAGE
jgi:ketosteroid isomerase-like protein